MPWIADVNYRTPSARPMCASDCVCVWGENGRNKYINKLFRILHSYAAFRLMPEITIINVRINEIIIITIMNEIKWMEIWKQKAAPSKCKIWNFMLLLIIILHTFSVHMNDNKIFNSFVRSNE